MDKLKKIYEKCKTSKIACVTITGICFIAVSYGVIFLSQFLLGAGTAEIDDEKIHMGMLCVLILFLSIYAFGLKTKLALILGTFVALALSTANYYTYIFRGNEMMPTDILALRTAMNVAGNYEFHFGKNVILPWVIFVVFFVVCMWIPEYRWKKKWKPRIVSVCMMFALIGLFGYASESYSTTSFGNNGMKTNGFIFNFAMQIKESFVKKPEGYLVEEIDELSRVLQAKVEDGTKKPDIIVIMDETFSDLGVLGIEPSTNQEVTPFIDSLEENTVKGNMVVSVIGGGTCTSEYEALTGNSHLFLQNSASVYQQYVNRESYSVVADMKKEGYKCIAMHPFHANGWKRSSVYEKFGFDETYFLEDFLQTNMIRQYVSDQEMFEKIIEEYEKNKNENNQQLFLFGVTMQNHGGYTYEGPNFEYSITLEGYEKEYKDVEQYLSLIHETDKAVEYLINYFAQEEREVIVVFFGDHQPALDEQFFTEISDVDFDTPEERLRRYTVPFFIWGNYDIQERDAGMISINYLMNEVYQTAGIKMPLYQQFLSEIRKTIPYMNKYAYYSLDKQAFIHLDEASGEEKEMLDLYWNVEYNNMFDHKNRNEEMFPIVKK